jgi:molecular chaperone DnaK
MYLGIDFGSTNTTACVWDGRLRMVELNQSGATSMPTVVTIVGSDILVGEEAIEAGGRHPDFDFRNFKRMLAEHWHPDEDTGHQTCEATDPATGAPTGMLAFRGPAIEPAPDVGPGYFQYSPTELASEILAEIVDAANKFLAPHDSVTGAAIGVPATFTPDQIAAVKEAARMAGIENVHVIEEPVAAAIAYNIDAKRPGATFVVDFGGGTLDTTITRARDGMINVLGKNGIGDLGGADWDRRIADYVINLWRSEHRAEIEAGEVVENGQLDRVMPRILAEAEAVKKRLSDRETTTFKLDIAGRTIGGVSLPMIYPVSRAILTELTRDLLDRMIMACKATIADAIRTDAKFSATGDIKNVLLVGGMTRVPAVRQAIEDFFGRAARKDENPEQVVAQGCAIKAAILEGRRPDVTVADILSFDVALEGRNNVPVIVIPRGTPFPLERTIVLSNADENQSEISLRLLWATRPRAEDCHLLEAQDIPVEPAPAESLRVKVMLAVNDEGHPSVLEVAL